VVRVRTISEKEDHGRDGTYQLELLDNGLYRLHLYSHFTLKTRFNFYASWWAGWIMEDIQDNILQVIKGRCEGR
jgi:hypothetical protein